MKIEYGVSTWLWTSPFKTDTLAMFPMIKSMGFDAVEIPIEDPSLINGKIIKKALEDNGLKAIACGAFGPTKDLTSDNVALHENCFEYLKKCFDLCNIWEVDFLAGPMYSAVGKARLVSPEQRKLEWSRAVTNINKVCEMADARGLSIALEPLNRFESDMINTAEDIMRLIGEVNHPRAKVLLDSFHMTIEETNLHQAVVTVGDKLIHVQVSENNRGTPGTGLTNWPDLKKGLQEINYKGCISIESFNPGYNELAGAVCIWKNLAQSQDLFATEGLDFLKKTFST